MLKDYVVTRYGMENVLKVGYPCSCHISPVESETYTAHFDFFDQSRISRIKVTCSNCGQYQIYDVLGRWLTAYDFENL